MMRSSSANSFIEEDFAARARNLRCESPVLFGAEGESISV
jgi:hypothetical protein